MSNALYKIIALLFIVCLLFAFGLRHILMPIVNIVAKITAVFERARQGDFSHRVHYDHHDEVGEIAQGTNQLMESLDKHIGAIALDVKTLTGQQTLNQQHQEPLEHIASVVHNLTSAVRFKEEIEADRNLSEVYSHFSRLLKAQFNIHRFALYEVSAHKVPNKLILSEGVPEGFDNWCPSEVLIDSDSCRAKRTVRIVDSRADSGVCGQFCGHCEHQLKDLRHICIPSLNSEGDGIILQIIFNQDEADAIEAKASLLQYYLRIAAPEVEAKRLMKTLRESTLRDALTGMYNRRFLEEFSSNLESSVARRQTSIGILMCDIDHFKQVNDTLGHALGDTVLKEVANIFHDLFRGSDLIIRYGGEEMLALVMDTEQDRLLDIAEILRQRIEAHTLRDGKDSFHVTISIGANMYPNESNTLAECICQADTALYEAKDSGRNKVIYSIPLL